MDESDEEGNKKESRRSCIEPLIDIEKLFGKIHLDQLAVATGLSLYTISPLPRVDE
jgi:hypothetical protein